MVLTPIRLAALFFCHSTYIDWYYIRDCNHTLELFVSLNQVADRRPSCTYPEDNYPVQPRKKGSLDHKLTTTSMDANQFRDTILTSMP